ncbi:TetR family transcriptional regulator C-terminal domain-containing protein [Arenibacter sp. GZD96]|uniref:TetR family transcriptional regulator C-terminal domain-containing protein n=1 Tax=Aurantibrevibacter litoralis TaxID=3106030 RepID=UPI002AFF9FC5|nr:TetR family transcriptional regulator C-terminal domain-containing protein [Arenibacter sp. GZD-96]MEA1787553.1 TetR family transcriptional regulator C-terminal domain-containing protein [Arenibacter sp. GZD-96]
MAKKTHTKETTPETLIAHYMNYVLEHEHHPKSVYKFCQSLGIEEPAFYALFGSLEGLKKAIWTTFYDNVQSLLQANEAYQGYGQREKLLTFFFTLFEILTLNRSYVLFCLKEHRPMLKNLPQLKDMRKRLLGFATDLIDEGNAKKTYKLTQHHPRLFSEAAWLQFLFLLQFWMDDASAGFEKTDIAIEKSVNTAFDVFDNTPLDNIIDFGKFLFKEKMDS